MQPNGLFFRRMICIALASTFCLFSMQLLAVAEAAPGKPDAVKEIEIIRDLPYFEGTQADAVKHKLDLYLPPGRRESEGTPLRRLPR